MRFRERTAHWFEIVVPRPFLARAVERLAASGAAELETADGASGGIDLSHAQAALDEYQRLQRKYQGQWPEPRVPAASGDHRLETALDEASTRLRAWEQEAAPELERLDRIARDRDALLDLRGLLAAMEEDAELDFGDLVNAPPPARARVFRLPPEWPTPRAAGPVLRLRIDTEDSAYLVVVGPEKGLDALEEQLLGAGARTIALPEWLEGTAADALSLLDERLGSLDEREADVHGSLERLAATHAVAESRGQILRVQWMLENLPSVQVGEYLARITGWTDTDDPDVLIGPLRDADIPAVIGFPDPPTDREPPRLTHNPFWARPFEMFMRLMGTPGQYEPDPSRLLAFIAPVLFGYMFGDVGQGAVLIAAGFLLRRYWPVMAMLIPGGAMAIVFGLVFGSVFTIEELFEPLWLHPVEHPLPVLVVPLVGGAGLILLGLLLNAVAASRRQLLGAWLRTDAGLVLTYAGALAAFVWPQPGLLAVAAGIGWYLLGCSLEWRRGQTAAVAGHMAELLERLLQLGVNTLSFLRVGAFALAHSGLSIAVITLADSTPGLISKVLVLIIGNVAILLLEGLVVSVQTTRLILFEFFIRFFQAQGRPFRPLSPPSAGSAPHPPN